MAFSTPPPPPPPSGIPAWAILPAPENPEVDRLTTALIQVIREQFPSKQEIVDAIRQGVKEAILEADD